MANRNALTQVRNPLLSAFPLAMLGLGPLSYYRIGEKSGSTCKDLGSRRADATIGTGVTLGQPGLIPGDPSTCALFGAGTGISVPTAGLPSGNNTIFSLVILAQYAVAPAAQQGLIGMGTWALREVASIDYRPGSSAFVGEIFGNDAVGSAPVVGKTYLLAMTADGTNVNLYQQGTLAGTIVDHTNVTLGAAHIGADEAGESFLGYLQEAGYFGFCLTPAQIAALAVACGATS
jgi:hypothetical protein